MAWVNKMIMASSTPNVKSWYEKHTCDGEPKENLMYSSLHSIHSYVCVTTSTQNNKMMVPLQWRHNERDGVSNHQPYDCLHNRLRPKQKKSKLRTTGFLRGINRWPVYSPHKWPVTPKMFSFNYVIMVSGFPWMPFVVSEMPFRSRGKSFQAY